MPTFLILCPKFGLWVYDEISDHVNIYIVIYMVPKKDKRSKPNPLNGNTFSTSLQSNKEQNMILKRCKTMLVCPFYILNFLLINVKMKSVV